MKRINSNKNNLPNTVDSSTGKVPIANLFKEKYDNLYNSVSYNETDMLRLLSDIDYKIDSVCCKDKCYHSHCCTVDIVTKCISNLNHGKMDGNKGHSTDHLIHGTRKLNTYLSLLFTSMLTHAATPYDMLLSTIIPIPKNKRKSLNDSENYRGIALSSSICKLFDWILLISNKCILRSSDLQFGYKESHSTSHCTFVLEEVINYYNDHNTDVYVVLLDASKAFDRVNYIKLFNLLLHKGLCPLVARFLARLYTRQIVRVKWNDYVTDIFNVSNGVKQGGVLLPILFSIYILMN